MQKCTKKHRNITHNRPFPRQIWMTLERSCHSNLRNNHTNS